MLDPVTCIGCSSCVMIGQSIIGYDVLHKSGKTSLSNEEDINLLTNYICGTEIKYLPNFENALLNLRY